jgi:hypothetical protein
LLYYLHDEFVENMLDNLFHSRQNCDYMIAFLETFFDSNEKKVPVHVKFVILRVLFRLPPSLSIMQVRKERKKERIDAKERERERCDVFQLCYSFSSSFSTNISCRLIIRVTTFCMFPIVKRSFKIISHSININ